MSVQPRNGKFVVRWREGRRHRSKTFTRAADARAYEAQVKRRLELGETILTRRDVPTLREEAISWLASKHDLTTTTEENYARSMRLHIFPDLGDLSLLDLRPRRLEEWQTDLLADNGTRTVQLARVVLSQILDRAVAHEYLPTNGLKVVKGPRHTTVERPAATVEQVEAMRAALDSSSDRALISVLAYVGLRPPQEPMGMLWSDIDGPRVRLHQRNIYGEIKPGLKAGCRERPADLPAPVQRELAELRIRKGRPTGLVFPRPDGQPWTKTDWNNWRRRRFTDARDAAGLPESFTPYDLRHTCASLMIATGRPVPEVAEQLGHSIEVNVRTYQHLLESMRGKPIVPLDDLIAEGRREAA